MWQYTSSGNEQIYGSKDLNICYCDLESWIKREGWNGFSATPTAPTRRTETGPKKDQLIDFFQRTRKY